MRKLLIFLFSLCAFACGGKTTEEPIQATPNCLEEPEAPLCFTDQGVNPTKASLAVAAALELKRWDPLKDFTPTSEGLKLSSEGLTRCSATGCPITNGLLGLQNPETNEVIAKETFDARNFRNDLEESFTRQIRFTEYLRSKHLELVPPDHQLELVKGPLNPGPDTCGPRYIFRAKGVDGKNLENPDALENNLVAFGGRGNPFIAFERKGRNKVSIDPIDGDTAPPTTTSGTCPTFEYDRVYDPNRTWIGKCCKTVSGASGTMVELIRSPGFSGCKAN